MCQDSIGKPSTSIGGGVLLPATPYGPRPRAPRPCSSCGLALAVARWCADCERDWRAAGQLGGEAAAEYIRARCERMPINRRSRRWSRRVTWQANARAERVRSREFERMVAERKAAAGARELGRSYREWCEATGFDGLPVECGGCRGEGFDLAGDGSESCDECGGLGLSFVGEPVEAVRS